MFAESNLLLWIMILQMNPRKSLQLQLFLQKKRLEPLRYEIDNLRAESLYNCKQKQMEQVAAKETGGSGGPSCQHSSYYIHPCAQGLAWERRKAAHSPAFILKPEGCAVHCLGLQETIRGAVSKAHFCILTLSGCYLLP